MAAPAVNAGAIHPVHENPALAFGAGMAPPPRTPRNLCDEWDECDEWDSGGAGEAREWHPRPATSRGRGMIPYGRDGRGRP